MKNRFLLHLCIVCLLIIQICQAEEAWFLEMDTRYADALFTKCRSGKLDDYRAALAMIPKLIQDSKIKEIERFSSLQREKNGPHGGTHFPPKKVPGKLGDKVVEFSVGSQYRGRSDYREFTIRKGEGLPMTVFSVITLGALGKEWAPTFLIHQDGRSRVLLERNCESADDLPSWPAVVSYTIGLPTPVTVAWPITKEARAFLLASPEDAAGLLKKGSYPEFSVEDVVEIYEERYKSVRRHGFRLIQKRASEGRAVTKFEHIVFHPTGKRIFDCRVGMIILPMKSNHEGVDIDCYEEVFDKESGETSNDKKKKDGKFECRVLP